MTKEELEELQDMITAITESAQYIMDKNKDLMEMLAKK